MSSYSVTSSPRPVKFRFDSSMDHLQKARRVLQIEISELQRLADRLDERFGEAVRLMLETVQAGQQNIVIGVGKSGQIVEKIAATLTRTGSPAFVLNPVNALHGDLGIVSEGDAVIATSYSGETAELLNILPALKRFDVRLICMTGDPDRLWPNIAKSSSILRSKGVPAESRAYLEHDRYAGFG